VQAAPLAEHSASQLCPFCQSPVFVSAGDADDCTEKHDRPPPVTAPDLSAAKAEVVTIASINKETGKQRVIPNGLKTDLALPQRGIISA